MDATNSKQSTETGNIEDVYVRRTDDRARDSYCQILMQMIIANFCNSSEGRDGKKIARNAKLISEAAWEEWIKGYGER